MDLQQHSEEGRVGERNKINQDSLRDRPHWMNVTPGSRGRQFSLWLHNLSLNNPDLESNQMSALSISPQKSDRE